MIDHPVFREYFGFFMPLVETHGVSNCSTCGSYLLGLIRFAFVLCLNAAITLVCYEMCSPFYRSHLDCIFLCTATSTVKQ